MKSIQPIKTKSEIEAMRKGGKILASIFNDLKSHVEVGMSELEVDAWVEQEIVARGATVTYKTAEVNFPNAICISVNDEIVHSIPTDYRFEKGDVVCFDLVITYDGMKVDSAMTVVIGEEPTGIKKHLLNYTERSLYAGIDAIKGGPIKTGDIASAIEKVLSDAKLGIVKELVGHGIGHSMQQAPEVPNYGRKGTGQLLVPGDTIAIEPMATLGSGAIKTDVDGWTIKTRDGSLSAHFEHTVMITNDGVEILTKL
jgi:methionyl aminopeptidase